MANETRIYDSEKRMRKMIKEWNKLGWRVVSSYAVDQGYKPVKTGCLGCLFLPLALLGKRKPKYHVTYEWVGDQQYRQS